MRWSPRHAWAARLLHARVPSNTAWKLLQDLGPAALDAASPRDWAPCLDKLTPFAVLERHALARAFDADAEELGCERLGVRLLLRDEPGYPDLLKEIKDPPVGLFLRGGPLEHPATAAFVGSRIPTAYGVRQAKRLAEDAARAGVCVVSGLARGLDGVCHAAALDAGGVTWAVVGGGLGALYPAEHRPLADRIVAKGGAVMSELPLQAPPTRETFLHRNRIVAGLSWAVVVIEGRARSGTLNTATHAADHGRVLLAVPGPADSPLSDAPHALLREGAILCRSAEDLLEALPPGVCNRLCPDTVGCGGDESQPGSGAPMAAPTLAADPAESRILALLGPDSLSLDELARLAGLDTNRISSIMFGLESKNLVIAVPGQRYAQKAR